MTSAGGSNESAGEWGNMVHETARELLERAQSFEDRQEAVRAAIDLGMPISEIEAFLDWLDLLLEQQRE